MSISFAEQARHDPALAAWLQAEITRAGIHEHTLRVELDHCQRVMAAQAEQIKALEQTIAALEKRRKA